MKLVVGLGNPGRKYQGTRHNVGFEVLAAVARSLHAGTMRTRFDGEFAEATCDGHRLLLLSPLTYMNLSGKSVQAARDFYQLSNADMLIICDDFQLPLGRLRFRADGSSGGQKGLEDVIRHCGSDVPRLRLGIGPVPPRWDPADFVLGRFLAEENAAAEKMVEQAALAVVDWIRHDTAYSMNKYNGPGAGEKT
jgi:PTH1 family peptidyl-tRNA hydrolase